MSVSSRAGARPGQRGFTLLELMLTLAIAAIVLVVGVPGMREFLWQSSLTTNINALASSLNTARSEAVARGRTVSICRSANPTAATPSCTTAAGAWATGWVVFVNLDEDSPAAIDAGETVLQAVAALDAGETLTSSAALQNSLSFSPEGIADATGEFVLCKNSDTDYLRSVEVERSGHIYQGRRQNDGSVLRRNGTTVASCTAI